MKRSVRLINSLVLAAAIAAPIAMQAQDHDRDNRNNNNSRVYDRQHKDYHTWNNDENNSYRQWYGQTNNGKQYRDYNKLHKKDQQAYWNYRHNNDRDRDHDKDHDKH